MSPIKIKKLVLSGGAERELGLGASVGKQSLCFLPCITLFWNKGMRIRIHER